MDTFRQQGDRCWGTRPTPPHYQLDYRIPKCIGSYRIPMFPYHECDGRKPAFQ